MRWSVLYFIFPSLDLVVVFLFNSIFLSYFHLFLLLEHLQQICYLCCVCYIWNFSGKNELQQICYIVC